MGWFFNSLSTCYIPSVDITNNLHKEFGKTVSCINLRTLCDGYSFAVCTKDAGPSSVPAEASGEGLWEAEGLHGKPVSFP